MKKIYKMLLAPFALVLMATLTYGQMLFHYPGKTLNEVKVEMERYFQEQVARFGPEILEGEASEYAMYQRWLSYWEPKLSPHGDFETYFAAEQAFHTAYPPARLLANGSPWFEIGPKEKPPCGMTSIGGGAVGIGPIEFITFYNPSPNFALCGSLNGGLFYTIDGGISWNNGNSDVLWNRSGCAHAAFAPNNENIWYAAQSGYIGFIKGIWRTTNQGTNWESIADQNDLNGVWTEIVKLVTNPGNPDELFAATSDGFYLSTNCTDPAPSVNWIKTLSGYVYDLEIRACPGCTQAILYASVKDNSGVWSVWESFDSGNSWAVVPGLPSTANINYITMELSLDPTASMMYFLYDYGNGTGDHFYQYNYNASVWSLQNTNRFVIMGGGHGFGMSNFNERTIYLTDGGYAGIYYSKSVDGGLTWTLNSGNNKYHVDIEDIVCHPANPDEVWMANHGGVGKSDDAGNNWSDISVGLGVAEAVGMSTSATDPQHILIGCYHDGTLKTNAPYVDPWYPDWCTVFGGDGQQPRIDYSDPQYMWVAAQGGSYWLSQNFGASFSPTNLPAEWFAYMIQNSQVPNVVYGKENAGGYKDIVRSNNRGITNFEIISDFATLLPGTAPLLPWKFYSARASGDYLYVHLFERNTWTHRIVRTKKALDPQAVVVASWDLCYTPQPNGWINDIETDPYNPEVIYITYSGYNVGTPGVAGPMVYRIDYTPGVMIPVVNDLTFNLPAANAQQLIKEKGPNGDLYLATDFGVYYTNNSRMAIYSGNEWMLFGSELPNVSVSGLEANYVINKLRAGHWGRGVWEHELYCPQDVNLFLSGSPSGNEYQEASNDITSTQTISSGLKVIYRAGHQINLLPGFQASTGSDFHAFIEPCDHSVYGLRKSFDALSDENIFKSEEETIEKRIMLYPNPGNGNYFFAKNFEDPCRLEVFDATGRLVLHKEGIEEDVSAVDLTDATNGILLVRVISGDKIFVARIVKQ